MSGENALLEIYKLDVDIAERAASSREEFTKLYTGVVSTIVAAGVLRHRLKPEGGTELSWVLPALGTVVSLTWLLSFLWGLVTYLATGADGAANRAFQKGIRG